MELLQRRLGRVERGGKWVGLPERVVLHGPPLAFDELCRRAVPREASFIVLDLDRTTHLGRNLGELLGWEVCAYLTYGPARYAELASSRRPGRFIAGERDLRMVARYFWLGARLWGYAGLFYLFWGKLATRYDSQRRRAFEALGAEPIREAQAIPQAALMQQLGMLEASTLPPLARAIWRRHQDDQVIQREHVTWLREWAPSARIVLSSASPEVMVRVAAEELGVDELVCTEVEVAGDRLATPLPPAPPALLVPRAPDRLAAPASYRVNAGYGKIERLAERYPELFAPGALTVGITDNGYGEDGSWSEYFTHVIDVNSKDPFPPIVTPAAPMTALHSAGVLSASERVSGRLDPRRQALDARRRGEVVLSRAELEAQLTPELEHLTALAQSYARLWPLESAARTSVAERLEALKAELGRAVEAYNRSAPGDRRGALKRAENVLARTRTERAELARLERPLSALTYEMTKVREAARARLSLVTAVEPVPPRREASSVLP